MAEDYFTRKHNEIEKRKAIASEVVAFVEQKEPDLKQQCGILSMAYHRKRKQAKEGKNGILQDAGK